MISSSEIKLSPTPLWFQVPPVIRDECLLSYGCELAVDFLCFEDFYQAVASSWPHEMEIVDVGGYVGIQGWLFRQFRGYYCVDSYDMGENGRDWPHPIRCRLPWNGHHVKADAREYLTPFLEFGDNLDKTLFICSAVPSLEARVFTSAMPNHVVWYPGEPMEAAGVGARATLDEFQRLQDTRWNESMSKLVRSLFN